MQIFVYFRVSTYPQPLAQCISIVLDELIIGTRTVLCHLHVPILFVTTNAPYALHVQPKNDHHCCTSINQPLIIENHVVVSTIPVF